MALILKNTQVLTYPQLMSPPTPHDRDEQLEYLMMLFQHLERQLLDLRQRVTEMEKRGRGKRREERNEGEKAGEGSPAD